MWFKECSFIVEDCPCDMRQFSNQTVYSLFVPDIWYDYTVLWNVITTVFILDLVTVWETCYFANNMSYFVNAFFSQ